MRKIHNDPETFNNVVEFNILPTKAISTIPKSDTTPTVSNVEYFTTVNVGAVTITNFVGGSDAQRLYILGEGFTSVANNSNIKTNTGATKLLAATKVYRFTLFNNVWYEDA